MESNLKTLVLNILENLLDEDLVKFKFQLTNISLAEDTTTFLGALSNKHPE